MITKKPVDALSVADLQSHPVWQFKDSDEEETWVQPVRRVPVTTLAGMVIGVQVELANKRLVWALIGNVEVSDARTTEQFVSLSFFRDDQRFELARYFDADYPRNGPPALACFLGLSEEEVFPIAYDIRAYAKGDPSALAGTIGREPRERLSRAELIALAVPRRS